MPITIRLQDIDEALENLRYKSETTLKSKLIRSIRSYYRDEEAAESLPAIDTEELVKIIWETGDDPALLKARRKNFSSLKSSVNADLKKLYTGGENPHGLVIGPGNTFTISDEAKDKALAGIMDVFREKGIDTQSKIGDILTALNDVLSSAVSGSDAENTKEEIERIKGALGGITEKLGVSLEDMIRGVKSAGERGARHSGTYGDDSDLHGDGTALAGDIHDELSEIDKGLKGLTQEIEDAQDFRLNTSLRRAFQEITGALGDTQTDAREKAAKIMAAFEQMLSETIDKSESGLSGKQADRLKQIFHELAHGAQIGETPEAAPASPAGDKLAETVSAILGDTGLGAGDKIREIMAAVENLVGEVLAEGGSGLDDAQIAGIKEMMGKITENIETLALEELTDFDITDEIISTDEEMQEEQADDEALVETVVTADEETQTEFVHGADGLSTDETEIAADEIIEEISLPEDELETVFEAEEDEAGVETTQFIDELPEAQPAQEDERLPAAETGLAADEMPEQVVSSEADLEEASELVEASDDEIDTTVEEVLEEIALSPAEDEPTDDVQPSEGPDGSGAGMEASFDIIEGEHSESARSDDETAFDTVQLVDEEVQVEVAPEDDGLFADETEIAADEIIEEISLPEDGLEAGFEAEEGGEDEIDTAVEEVLEEVALPPAEGGPLDSTQLADGPDISVTTSDSDIDGQLREKTELLTRLAQAAQELASLGPDLTGSVYTEEEIREKAQFLSEEFNRYLSLRDKFYNAHVLIKGGNYLVGGAHLTKSELAEQIAVLPDFYIGKFPVTNAIFEIFIEQTGYITTAERYGYSIVYFPRMQHSRDPVTGVERFSLHKSAYSRKVTGACWHRPLGPESSLHLKRTHPVVHVSLEDARAFASWTGKRLPTEIEWEAAARTAQAYIFPWGNQWQENACNTEAGLHGDTTPVDHYIKFANQAGVADTLGNILEWTGDVLGDNTETDMCITKGASWIARGEISLTDRHYVEKDTSSNILGFRCVAI